MRRAQQLYLPCRPGIVLVNDKNKGYAVRIDHPIIENLRRSDGEPCMKYSPRSLFVVCFAGCAVAFCLSLYGGGPADAQNTGQSQDRARPIKAIVVHGNKYVPTSAILNRVPFRVGELFNPLKTGSMIRGLYKDLKRFRTITVKGKNLDDKDMELHIFVEEKIPLKEATFKGNSQVSTADITKKINFAEIPAIDKDDLVKYMRVVRKLYADKGFHHVDIKPDLIMHDDGTATAAFDIKEHARSMVKRILFEGNHAITSKKLRGMIMTREEWILSAIDKSGIYQPERLEADRHFIETLYQSSGYLNAKVIDIDVSPDEKTGQLTITYHIEEGDRYFIKDVKAPGNDILSEAQILSALPVRPGQIYSRELIAASIQTLETIWGNRGYVYAHIEPSIIPDDETKTVNLSFTSDIGSKVYLNKITIKGNKKSRDKVIRRAITLTEGEPITNFHMENSKNRVGSLGYFDQNEGVNWKMTRLSEDLADLDLIVKEVPTGNAHIKIGFGGTDRDIRSPIAGLSAELAAADRNLFGSGIQLNAAARLSKDERTFNLSLANPWLFDKPLFSKGEVYYRSAGYEEFHHTNPVNERDCGGNITLGFVTGPRYFPFVDEMFVRANVGVDSIRYAQRPVATMRGLGSDHARRAYQGILDKLFTPADFAWTALNIGQDTRNHPVHPSRGQSWLLEARVAVPSASRSVAFHKVDLDFNWYTPFIGEHDLVFHAHSHVGFVNNFRGYVVPYRELYNIGGPASVRGFLFGQIGPQFMYDGIGDPIGGRKTFFWNAELIFPITPDFNMKGFFFYDGGSGWDNPYINADNARFIRSNGFDYRHSVGVGVQVLSPMPVKISWGFKLDPRPGETPYEVHFGMIYDW